MYAAKDEKGVTVLDNIAKPVFNIDFKRTDASLLVSLIITNTEF